MYMKLNKLIQDVGVLNNDELNKVIEAYDIDVLGSSEGFFWAACFFVLFELAAAHLGEVAPPFQNKS